MERDAYPDDGITALIEHVYLGSQHVGTVYEYPRHCEAVPEDGSRAYLFQNRSEGAHWLRMRCVNVDAADVWLTQHAIGPA